MPTQTRLISQNFELVSGNTKRLDFVHKDQNGSAVDITGATIIWALSDHQKAKKNRISYTTPSDVEITDAANGKYSVHIKPADTEPLIAKNYFHEVRITSAGSDVHTAVRGMVEVLHNTIDT